MGLLASTWLFGALLLLLTGLAVGFAIWPLRCTANEEPQVSRKQANIAFYEARVEELDNALSLGEMTAEEVGLQKAEAARHLLEDASAGDALPQSTAGGRWMYLFAALLIPLIAVSVYLQGDGWRLINADEKSPPWDFIIHRAQDRLAKDPKDLETWVFLARSYRALEKFPESAQAYAELNQLTDQSNADFLVEEGEMLAMIDEGNLRGRPTELFALALKANPNHGRGLWYAGLAARQRNDEAQAIQYWQTLATQPLPESFRQLLSRQLKHLNAEVPEQRNKTALQAVIRVRVEAQPELVADLPANTTVFVYAKSQTGPARPLAAQRLTLSDLPATVELTDAMRMADGPALSDFSSWTVYARVAPSGNAQPEAADPIGEITLDKAQALSAKSLLIDSRWSE